MVDGQSKSPEKWEMPPQSVFKINFDVAAKGNTGPAGVGGACRNMTEEIVVLY